MLVEDLCGARQIMIEYCRVQETEGREEREEDEGEDCLKVLNRISISRKVTRETKEERGAGEVRKGADEICIPTHMCLFYLIVVI